MSYIIALPITTAIVYTLAEIIASYTLKIAKALVEEQNYILHVVPQAVIYTIVLVTSFVSLYIDTLYFIERIVNENLYR